MPGGHLLARAGHRHGGGGPGGAGGVAEVGDRRAPADRPRRAQRGRRLEGPDLPQVPRRPARVRRGGEADARRRDRGDGGPAQPARRAGPADRGDDVGGAADGVAACPELHDDSCRRAYPYAELSPRAARQRARHARRALPLRRVRRAAAAHRVGPGGGHDQGPARGAAAGGDERRHDPRPRALRRAPARRPPRRGARRGDGLRGAARPDVPARRLDLADRGDHPRPGDRDPRSRRARRRAVLEGRRRGTAGGAGQGDRRVLALGGGPRACTSCWRTTTWTSARRPTW